MFELRPMSLFDIPFGLALSTQAGWNQIEYDWRLLLSADANGGWVALYEGHPAGTLTAVLYPPDIVWVGMVLVEENFRQRGIATGLIKSILKPIDDHHSFYLDATSMGEGLYLKVGFEADFELVRMCRSGSRIVARDKKKSAPLPAADLGRIMLLDQQVFGSNRGFLLSALVRDYPNSVFVLRDRENVIGFCLGREGRIHHQIGPLVASDLVSAQNLLYSALEGLEDQSIILDVPSQHTKWLDLLRSLGFQDQRKFTRMRYGIRVLDTKQHRYYAAAGPEFG
jgi:hypothetical protein